MTLMLELTPQQEQKLADEAARHGMEAGDYALDVLHKSRYCQPRP